MTAEDGRSLSDMVNLYRRGAAGTAAEDPTKEKENHDIMHRCYKFLRTSSAGREAIATLMQDQNPHVQLWAAAHSLAWAKEQAKQTLIALSDSEGPGSFDARITLQEYEKGTLSFEYE